MPTGQATGANMQVPTGQAPRAQVPADLAQGMQAPAGQAAGATMQVPAGQDRPGSRCAGASRLGSRLSVWAPNPCIRTPHH